MIGLLGGTFNPIHRGHLQLAASVCRDFALSRVEFLPCHIPVHRDHPDTTATLRQQMVELAIADSPRFVINDSELRRGGVSYAVDTLRELRQQRPSEVIGWLMGVDAFNGFADWKEPKRILQMTHLIVCTRPGVTPQSGPFSEHYLACDQSLEQHTAGKIVFHSITPNPCSSTAIRQQLARGEMPADCLSPAVIDFIKTHNLYANDT